MSPFHPREAVVRRSSPAGARPKTALHEGCLAAWAKRLSWMEVARAFRTSWQMVFRSVEMAVGWGRVHMDLTGITAIGVDEILWQRGHKYLTVVYQSNAECKRLLWVGQHQQVKTLLRFLRWVGKERGKLIRFVCGDLWKPYVKVIAKKAGHATHVLGRFHVMSHLSKALDEVRAKEAKVLAAKGHEPVLSPHWAGWFLDGWCTKVLRSRIEPMAKVARMLRTHRDLLLNWFRAKGRSPPEGPTAFGASGL